MEKLRVPTPFQYPPFYEKQSTISTVTTSFSQKVTQFPFYYDILKYLNIDALQPWNKKETYIPLLFTCWSESKNLLMEYYRFRERKKANPIMKISIAMLIQSVWWMNNTEVKSIVQFDQLKIKPINFSDRIPFILDDPDHYHSFVQINALFEESEKLYHKMILIEKRLM